MRILGAIIGLCGVTAFGALTGAIVGLLLLVIGMPLWMMAAAGHAGGEDLALAVAIGCGGLCGAAAALAVVTAIVFGPSPSEH